MKVTELTRVRPARPALFIGVAYSALAAMTVLGPGEGTLTRWATAFGLAIAAAALVALGRRRQQLLGSFDVDAKKLRLRDGTTHSILDTNIELVTATRRGRAVYRAELVLADEKVVLTENEDPALVLEQARELGSNVGLDVIPGWGLDQSPVDLKGSLRAPSGSLDLCGEPKHPHRAAGVTVLVAGVIAGIVLASVGASAVGRGHPLSSFSVAIAVCTIAITAIIGLAVASWQQRLRSDDSLWVEVRMLGVTWKSRSVTTRSVRSAQIVGAPGAPRHVLIDSSEGTLSLPCTRATAVRLRDSVLAALG